MRNKGISPLIAAVILIAFVIAIAGVASGFFTGFIQSKTSQISQAGTETVDCGVATIKIEPDTVNTTHAPNNISLAVEGGKTKLENITVTTYGEDNVTTDSTPLSPSSDSTVTLQKGETEYLVVKPVGNNIDKIKVGTPTCPNKDSVVTLENNQWAL